MVITQLWISSGPNCLLSGTSVNIQCVNFGFPRPQIVFFQGTEQIITGEGSRFTQVSFDTVRLSGARQADSGDYVCEARMGTNELSRSQPQNLVFCSKLVLVTAFTSYSHKNHVFILLPHSSVYHSRPASTNDSH